MPNISASPTDIGSGETSVLTVSGLSVQKKFDLVDREDGSVDGSAVVNVSSSVGLEADEETDFFVRPPEGEKLVQTGPESFEYTAP